MKLPEKLVPILKDIFLKLQTHKILIEDLHFIYNDNELYIIDPFNVFNLSDLTHIGHYRDRNFYHQTNIKYINQIKKLKKLLDFNTSPS